MPFIVYFQGPCKRTEIAAKQEYFCRLCDELQGAHSTAVLSGDEKRKAHVCYQGIRDMEKEICFAAHRLPLR